MRLIAITLSYLFVYLLRRMWLSSREMRWVVSWEAMHSACVHLWRFRLVWERLGRRSRYMRWVYLL